MVGEYNYTFPTLKRVTMNRKYLISVLFVLFFFGCGGGSSKESNNNAPTSSSDTIEEPSQTAVYVSAANGDDNNLGTIGKPKLTIQAAIDLASSYSPPLRVNVTEGYYSAKNDLGPPVITMHEGVSVYGGYSSDFSNRSTLDYRSVIKDLSAEGGSSVLPNCCVVSAGSITERTSIEGFAIVGGGGAFAAAVCNLMGSQITIRDNFVYVANSTPDNGYGIFNMASSPVIVNNAILGGSGYVNFGIVNVGASPLIDSNIITPASGYYSRGIYNYDLSSPTIQNNVIVADNGSSSYGVINVSSHAKVRNNTIVGGSGIESFGIYMNNNSTMEIENNIILTDGCIGYGCISYCIYEDDLLSNASSLRNNNLFNCEVLYGNNNVTKSSSCLNCGMRDVENLTSIEDVNFFEKTTQNSNYPSSGNVSLDPRFVDLSGGDFSLQASTPEEIRSGGIDGGMFGFGYSLDLGGKGRTGDGSQGWSIGALEMDE